MGYAANSLPVPANGVYLGIQAHPNLAPNQEQAIEILEGPAPNGINHTFALHLAYYGWANIAAMLDSNGIFRPDSNLAGDIGHGRVPVISWACDASVASSDNVIAGGNASQDAVITATANALKQYPGPVLLRWFWEFNDLSNNQTCRGDTGGAPTAQVYNGFIGAWQHIWTLFQKASANNVVFLVGAFYRIVNTVYLSNPGPPAAAPNANCSVYISGSGWECYDRFQYNPSDPISGKWKNLAPAVGNACGQAAGNQAIAGDIEVLDCEQNITSKLRISCVDATNHIVYLTGPTEIAQNNPGRNGFITGNRYLVDNVADDLTVPGQWFLDRSTIPWTLTYLANAGENPNTGLVIVPQISQVLVASGFQYVTFRGLTFEHDNYTIPAAGHPSTELEPDISAAVSFQNSQYITFDSATVTQVSGTGLEFISCVSPASPAYCASINSGGATGYNTIENSAVFDIGALGIRIGDPYLTANTDANAPQSFLVQNNVVEGYGRTILSGSAKERVMATYTRITTSTTAIIAPSRFPRKRPAPLS